MNLGLQEKVVLVTGASKGLSKAINAGSIGRFAAFEGLSSEAASFISGTNLRVDGGSVASV